MFVFYGNLYDILYLSIKITLIFNLMRKSIFKITLLVISLVGITVTLFFTAPEKPLSDLALANIEALAGNESDVVHGDCHYFLELEVSHDSQMMWDGCCDICYRHCGGCSMEYVLYTRTYTCVEVKDSTLYCCDSDEYIVYSRSNGCDCNKYAEVD